MIIKTFLSLCLLSAMVVPRPVETQTKKGFFTFSEKTLICVDNQQQALSARLLADVFTESAGFTPQVKELNRAGRFWYWCKKQVIFETDTSLPNEGYVLTINHRRILIQAANEKGFFYAVQTLRQLLPQQAAKWRVGRMKIVDYPRFEYRGFMLDVSRFFLPKEYVCRLIDCMGLLKINKLHLHLTDDNGWRMEIKKYPLLTQVGAWRVDRTSVPFPDRRNAQVGEEATIGGYYTQDDLREMVAYAADRQVEIIPEIDIPAHSLAALAAYPSLACPVVDHSRILPAVGMGIGVGDILFCAGNDSTFTMLEDVLDEVMDVFPSSYIHLGGDEARKTYWEKCPLCQARMKAESLQRTEDLQGYFMNHVATYVQSKGRKVMGWDEWTNSYLPNEAVVFGWQGMGQAALKAADQGHRFVMTPARQMYLIRYQGPQWFEPQTYFGNITLKDVYDYEPVQQDWPARYDSLLMGVQASLWTEFCNKPTDVEYLAFPRLAALAEVGWIAKDSKDWEAFLPALDNVLEHMRALGVTIAPSMFNIQHTVTTSENALHVHLENIRPDLEIRYTLDGSTPTCASLRYQEPLSITKDVVVKANTFSKEGPMGQVLTLPLKWNLATAKQIINSNSTTQLLVNGVRGSIKNSDFEWCSWPNNQKISFTVDLGSVQTISQVQLGFLNSFGMGFHLPKHIVVQTVQKQGQAPRVLAEKSFSSDTIFREGYFVEDISFTFLPTQERYVMVTLYGPGLCPAQHVRYGQESRIALDEVQII